MIRALPLHIHMGKPTHKLDTYVSNHSSKILKLAPTKMIVFQGG